jgi:putative ABC transport system permease protein
MIGTSIRQGRTFDDTDTRSSPLVAIVNESMARAIWPGESAIGKCIRAGYGVDPSTLSNPMDAAASAPCREVVGVVKDSRARSLRAEGFEARQMQYYVPFDQVPAPPFPNFSEINGLFVQVRGDIDRARTEILRIAQKDLARPGFVKVIPYQDLIDPQLRSWRLGASLFTVFGAIALLIAAIGLFAVISYLVNQRTREIGVRIAIGATMGSLWRLIVLDSLKLVAIGIGTGIVAAMAAAPYLRDLLFQTAPWDLANLATAVTLLVAVTIVAALAPAWRAGRVDPLTALRADG